MFSLIKKILNGSSNMNSTESSGEKEEKMISVKTNVPEIDRENVALFKAAQILEMIGNEPNPTANQFYAQLLLTDLPLEDHEDVTLAAISIETMMNMELLSEEFEEPTVH
jgi:hypothetical protein